MPFTMAHYTDRDGFNGIASAPVWKFVAAQPPASHHPMGTYFTTLGRDERQLAKKLRIPKSKAEYVFEFTDAGDLEPIDGGRGAFIFFSRTDYFVQQPRQVYSGARAAL
jgi:hypothetical protein